MPVAGCCPLHFANCYVCQIVVRSISTAKRGCTATGPYFTELPVLGYRALFGISAVLVGHVDPFSAMSLVHERALVGNQLKACSGDWVSKKCEAVSGSTIPCYQL